MRYRFLVLPLCVGIFTLCLMFFPGGTAQAGIVPSCPANGCRACDIVTLANNVMKFLLMISVFVAMLIVAAAGFNAVVSGSGEALMSSATNIILGIIIMLIGWLVVDTLIKYLTGNALGPWNHIECVENPNPTKFGEKGTAGVSVIPGGSSKDVYGNGDSAANGGPQGTPSPSQLGTGDCSPAAMSGFGSGAQGMSCIANAESHCSSQECGDNGFSCGIFQVNMTANNVICNGQTLNCPSAFTGMYTGSNHNVSIRPGMESLVAQCKTALQDPSCSQQTAQNIYNQRGFRPWSTAGACGLR